MHFFPTFQKYPIFFRIGVVQKNVYAWAIFVAKKQTKKKTSNACTGLAQLV